MNTNRALGKELSHSEVLDVRPFKHRDLLYCENQQSAQNSGNRGFESKLCAPVLWSCVSHLTFRVSSVRLNPRGSCGNSLNTATLGWGGTSGTVVRALLGMPASLGRVLS